VDFALVFFFLVLAKASIEGVWKGFWPSIIDVISLMTRSISAGEIDPHFLLPGSSRRRR